MVRHYLFLAATLMVFLVVIINHNNFTFAATNITTTILQPMDLTQTFRHI